MPAPTSWLNQSDHGEAQDLLFVAMEGRSRHRFECGILPDFEKNPMVDTDSGRQKVVFSRISAQKLYLPHFLTSMLSRCL